MVALACLTSFGKPCDLGREPIPASHLLDKGVGMGPKMANWDTLPTPQPVMVEKLR